MEISRFNLDFFRESANGDAKFMKYILNLTARELRLYFDQLTAAWQEGNRENAKRACHKLRPHLEALHAQELEALIGRLMNETGMPSLELLQAFQEKAALLCNTIQQAANDEE